MKHIQQFITEKKSFLVNKRLTSTISNMYQAKDIDDLKNIILDRLSNGDTDLNDIDVTNITDMTGLFKDINIKLEYKLGHIDIDKWNMINVVNAYGMFEDCTDFEADLSNWNVSNIRDMSYMFMNCHKFNSDLSNWNTTNIEHMTSAFFGCWNLYSELNDWDVSKVRDMSFTFSYCEKFNSNLSKWNISNVEDMYKMFRGCESFMGKGIDKWKPSDKLRNYTYMFDDCTSLKNKPSWYKK